MKCAGILAAWQILKIEKNENVPLKLHCYSLRQSSVDIFVPLVLFGHFSRTPEGQPYLFTTFSQRVTILYCIVTESVVAVVQKKMCGTGKKIVSIFFIFINVLLHWNAMTLSDFCGTCYCM